MDYSENTECPIVNFQFLLDQEEIELFENKTGWTLKEKEESESN